MYDNLHRPLNDNISHNMYVLSIINWKDTNRTHIQYFNSLSFEFVKSQFELNINSIKASNDSRFH